MPDVWIDDRRGDVGLALCNFGQVDLRNGVKTILRTNAAPGPLFSPTADSAREDRFLCFVPRRGFMHARIGALTGGLPVVRGQALY